MTALSTILGRAGVETLAVLDARIDVPVLTGVPQAQGDILVMPSGSRRRATTPIPREGVLVVRSAAGSNTHSLHSWDGPSCCYDAFDGGGTIVGLLTVPDGATAYLVHTEEHGANAFGPGTYTVRRQRERSDHSVERRDVADGPRPLVLSAGRGVRFVCD